MMRAGALRIVEQIAGLTLIVAAALWSLVGILGALATPETSSIHPNIYVAPLVELEARNYASPGGIIAQSDGASAVELRVFLGRPVFRVDTHAGAQLYDAQTGELLPPISRLTAREAAKRVYIGEGRVKDIEFVEEPAQAWRVVFDDARQTTLFVARDSGDLISVEDGRRSAVLDARTNLEDMRRGAAGAVLSILTIAALIVFLGTRGVRVLLQRRKA